MTERAILIETAFSAIERAGLVPRGAFKLEEGERIGELADIRTIVLAGMAGRDGWNAFAASPEASDGLADPLDRWSRRLIESLARELGGEGAVPLRRAAFLAVPAMGAASRTGPFLTNWPINSPVLRPVAFLPRRAWAQRRARRRRAGAES